MILSKVFFIKNKNLKIDIFICLILFVLFLISLFSIFNLIAVIKLQNQIDNILSRSSVNKSVIVETKTLPKQNETASTTPNSPIDYIVDAVSNILNFTGSSNKIVPLETPLITLPAVKEDEQVYYNANSEPFFGPALVNTSKTNLRLDDVVTALTFDPSYELNYEKTCNEKFCGLLDQKKLSCLSSGCLFLNNNKIYFKDAELRLPAELQNKKIVNTSFDPLSTKWVVSFVENNSNQEEAYVYLFDGNNFQPLVNSESGRQIKTRYGYGGGSVTASGTDNQFLILYSGYEGFAYLYNNGSWQDLSIYFGLRATNGGFKAKIIKGGDGNLANWYVCSEDGSRAKLIKLWQNNTDMIQGSIDLSSVLNGEAFICNFKNNRELTLVGSKQYTFKDNGFKNTKDYYYESNNLSSYTDKKIRTMQLSNVLLNANADSYSFSASLDAKKWQPYFNAELPFDNKENLSTFYIKADFKKGSSEYSPWFGGIDIISYSAVDKK